MDEEEQVILKMCVFDVARRGSNYGRDPIRAELGLRVKIFRMVKDEVTGENKKGGVIL